MRISDWSSDVCSSDLPAPVSISPGLLKFDCPCSFEERSELRMPLRPLTETARTHPRHGQIEKIAGDVDRHVDARRIKCVEQDLGLDAGAGAIFEQRAAASKSSPCRLRARAGSRSRCGSGSTRPAR